MLHVFFYFFVENTYHRPYLLKTKTFYELLWNPLGSVFWVNSENLNFISDINQYNKFLF